jgi:hypothetical protein
LDKVHAFGAIRTETVLLLIVIIELVTLVKVLFMVLVKGATVSSSASALTLRYNVGANAYAIIGDTIFQLVLLLLTFQ